MGRRVTVALTPAGNNFIMGGKHTTFSAEDVYTVCSYIFSSSLSHVLQHLTTPVFGKDVVYDCPNELLMEQKKFIKFGLSTDNFRQYVGMIEGEVMNFMRNDPGFRVFQMNDINEWGAFDVVKVISEITILTASRTLQGREVRSQITKEYAQVYSDLDGGFTPLHFMFPNLPLESYRKRDAAHKKISDFYVSIIQKRRENPDAVRGPYIHILYIELT
jgi:sterol 14alpha-demethylase